MTTEYRVDRFEGTPRGSPASLLQVASESERKMFEKALLDGMTEADAYDVLATAMGMKEGHRMFKDIDRRPTDNA